MSGTERMEGGFGAMEHSAGFAAVPQGLGWRGNPQQNLRSSSTVGGGAVPMPGVSRPGATADSVTEPYGMLERMASLEASNAKLRSDILMMREGGTGGRMGTDFAEALEEVLGAAGSPRGSPRTDSTGLRINSDNRIVGAGFATKLPSSSSSMAGSSFSPPRNFLESLPLAIVATTVDGIITYWYESVAYTEARSVLTSNESRSGLG